MSVGLRHKEKVEIQKMKKKIVVDASALLAAIHNEKGGDFVKSRIDHCVISTVNWSEVLQKLERADANVSKIEQGLKALGLSIVDFTEDDAKNCASLWLPSKKLGLSLADRACLATGLRLKSDVITADRVWNDLDINLEIHLIR